VSDRVRHLIRRTFEDPVAFFTLWLALFTLVLAGVSIGQGRHLQREFVTEHRPWLSVKVEPYNWLKFGKEHSGIAVVRFALENTGRTPATRARVDYAIVPPFGDPVAVQRAVAKDVDRKGQGAAADAGNTVFPGGPATLVIARDIPADTVANWRAWIVENPKLVSTAITHIVGCVLYGSTVDAKAHHTGFIRELHGLRPNESGYWPILPQEGAVPADALETSGSVLGSGQID
jgi:hypothetical protein